MRGVNNRNFLNLWQMVYRASVPSPVQTKWRVGEVEWRKERHSFSGVDYAVSTEVHHLRSRPPAGRSWSLMVVTEHWWGDDGKPMKSASWARVLEGNPSVIAAWLKSNETGPRD
jgi:hypothetical protein